MQVVVDLGNDCSVSEHKFFFFAYSKMTRFVLNNNILLKVKCRCSASKACGSSCPEAACFKMGDFSVEDKERTGQPKFLEVGDLQIWCETLSTTTSSLRYALREWLISQWEHAGNWIIIIILKQVSEYRFLVNYFIELVTTYIIILTLFFNSIKICNPIRRLKIGKIPKVTFALVDMWI